MNQNFSRSINWLVLVLTSAIIGMAAHGAERAEIFFDAAIPRHAFAAGDIRTALGARGIATGQLGRTADTAGISALMARSAIRGAAGMDAEQLAVAAERLGGAVSPAVALGARSRDRAPRPPVDAGSWRHFRAVSSVAATRSGRGRGPTRSASAAPRSPGSRA